MEFLIPYFRLIHFVGFALLLGGTLTSVIVVKRFRENTDSVKVAWTCMHLVAAPGLLLLLCTGILHSSALYWENFRDAGYMHVKVFLAAIVLVLLIADMRTQKKILKHNPSRALMISLLKKRQALALGVSCLVVVIMWLVSFRPF